MRFLLHPVTVSKGRNNGLRPAVTAVVNQAIIQGDSTSSSASPRSQASLPQASWGQQCSPNCGCVLRFETTVNAKNGTILSAKYTAKQILTDAQGHVQLTNRSSRPMMKDSSCKSLHHLASAVVDKFLLAPNATWERCKSQLEFDAIRSSPAFGKAVLQSQNLPLNASACFDLVEEALTAMLKGYLPKQRKVFAISQSSQSLEARLEEDPRLDEDDTALLVAPYNDLDFSRFTHNLQQHYDTTIFPFGQLWKHDYATTASFPGKTSTMLDFVDEQQDRLLALSKKNQLKKVPVDWVDYVDYMIQEAEESQSA